MYAHMLCHRHTVLLTEGVGRVTCCCGMLSTVTLQTGLLRDVECECSSNKRIAVPLPKKGRSWRWTARICPESDAIEA